MILGAMGALSSLSRWTQRWTSGCGVSCGCVTWWGGAAAPVNPLRYVEVWPRWNSNAEAIRGFTMVGWAHRCCRHFSEPQADGQHHEDMHCRFVVGRRAAPALSRARPRHPRCSGTTVVPSPRALACSPHAVVSHDNVRALSRTVGYGPNLELPRTAAECEREAQQHPFYIDPGLFSCP